MRIGCLIVSILGLLFGLDAFFSGFRYLNDGYNTAALNFIVGGVLIVVCGIYISSWLVKRSNRLKEEALLKAMQSTPPLQEQPYYTPPQSSSPGLTSTQSGLFIPQSEETDEQ